MELCELEATVTDPADPEAAAMVEAMEAEMEDLYSDRFISIHSKGASADGMGPPHGSYVLVRVDGAVVGGGGLKRLDETTCEIKRMYLVPEVRGRGLSRSLLAALEERARSMGYERARLDTADRQPAAKRLYEAAGYRSIPMYNGNRFARFWFEREL